MDEVDRGGRRRRRPAAGGAHRGRAPAGRAGRGAGRSRRGAAVAALPRRRVRRAPFSSSDAHCPLTADGDVALVLAAAEAAPAVGVRPVTDTVKRVHARRGGDWLGATVDRESLVWWPRPLVVPDASALAGVGARRPGGAGGVAVAAGPRSPWSRWGRRPPGARRLRPRGAHRRLSSRSASGDVLGERHLEVGRGCGHRRDRQIGVPGDAGRGVGAGRTRRSVGPTVGGEQRTGPERLRGLDPTRSRTARRPLGSEVPAGASPGWRRRTRAAADSTARQSRAAASGRAESWIATTSSSPEPTRSARAWSAAHSESCRVAPPVDDLPRASQRAARRARRRRAPRRCARRPAGARPRRSLEVEPRRVRQHRQALHRQQHLVAAGADPAARAGGQQHRRDPRGPGGVHTRSAYEALGRKASSPAPVAPERGTNLSRGRGPSGSAGRGSWRGRRSSRA